MDLIKNNTTCPLCSNTTIEPIYDISCDRFDTSFLYQTIKLVYCIKCGHVFNYLTETELNNLNKYYTLVTVMIQMCNIVYILFKVN